MGSGDREWLSQKSRKKGCCSCIGYLKYYLSVSNNPIKMPTQIEYIGSVFAWGSASVFDVDVWNPKQIHPKWVLLLCTLPGLFAIAVLVPICLLCFLGWVIFLGPWAFLSWCWRGTFSFEWPWNWNYWMELIHF